MKLQLVVALLGVALLVLAPMTGCEFKGHGNTAHYGIDPLEATEANFNELVLQSRQPVMVDCWADWCDWCTVLKPTVHELAADYQGRAVVAQLNTDEHVKVAQRYNVKAWPTLLFFKDGKLVDRVEGAAPKAELSAKLNALLVDSSVANSN